MEKTIIARALSLDVNEELGISRSGADQANNEIRSLEDWELVLAGGGDDLGVWH